MNCSTRLQNDSVNNPAVINTEWEVATEVNKGPQKWEMGTLT